MVKKLMSWPFIVRVNLSQEEELGLLSQHKHHKCFVHLYLNGSLMHLKEFFISPCQRPGTNSDEFIVDWLLV
jgi:hypothetical protein